MDASGTAELVAALPLAEAALRLLQRVTDEEPLKQLFEEHRGRAYESVLTFRQMVQLIGDALLEAGGSGYRILCGLRKRATYRLRLRPCTASWGGSPSA